MYIVIFKHVLRLHGLIIYSVVSVVFLVLINMCIYYNLKCKRSLILAASEEEKCRVVCVCV